MVVLLQVETKSHVSFTKRFTRWNPGGEVAAVSGSQYVLFWLRLEIGIKSYPCGVARNWPIFMAIGTAGHFIAVGLCAVWLTRLTGTLAILTEVGEAKRRLGRGGWEGRLWGEGAVLGRLSWLRLEIGIKSYPCGVARNWPIFMAIGTAGHFIAVGLCAVWLTRLTGTLAILTEVGEAKRRLGRGGWEGRLWGEGAVLERLFWLRLEIGIKSYPCGVS
jgi:hypothetical protein